MLHAQKRQHGCCTPKRLHRATFVGGIHVSALRSVPLHGQTVLPPEDIGVSLAVMGINHRTGHVELREQLAFRTKEIPKACREFCNGCAGASVVILSTCNRVEIYAHHLGMPAPNLASAIADFLSASRKLPDSAFRKALYEYDGNDAVEHLFRVTSSLDSLVMGEAQILGQVHDAYLMARLEKVVDKVLHSLFQRAFSVAKAVRSETGVGAGNISISSVAVDYAASIFGDFSDKTVMVIGAGEMSELTLKALMARGVGRLLVLNRSTERAADIAACYGGEAVSFKGLRDHLHRADIVISSTGSPHRILHAASFREAMPRRDYAPMFVIDIAVPRDVEREVGEIDNVHLYNIDNLEEVVAENLDARRAEAEKATVILDRAVNEFDRWHRGIAAEPTIASMARELRAIQQAELEKTLATLPGLNEKQRQEVSRMAERIVNKILHSPMTQIKHEIGHHDPPTVLHLARRLFGVQDGHQGEKAKEESP